jgi:flagellar hook protein FlgE
MDVIGNNIANVNTTAYKAQNMVFSDLLYQQTQAATGANASTGRGGTNPRQIGLGAKTAAISTAITRQGSAQSTNNPFDIMITGESFFVVNNGTQNFFTRDGSFTIDGAGNLVMASTGFKVMGWQVDPETGDIRPDVVSALQVMNKDNLTVGAESTTRAYASGILDKNDTNVNSPGGRVMTLHFYDNLGYDYTAKFSIHSTGAEGRYRIKLDDIVDADSVSLVKKYNLNNIEQIASFGNNQPPKEVSAVYTMNSNASYDAAKNAYTVNFANSEILTGYEDHALFKVAGDNVKMVTTLTTGSTVAANTDITMEGKVTLNKSQLQGKPYNLIYENDKWYTKDDKGNPVEITDEAGWKSALQGIEGMDTVTIPAGGVETQGSDVTITFQQTFKTNQESTWTGTAFATTLENTEANQDEILERVYNLTQGTDGKTFSINYVAPGGTAQITSSEDNGGFELVYDVDNGTFVSINGADSATLSFQGAASTLTGDSVSLTHFSNIDIDFTSTTMLNNGKVTTIGADPGAGDEANTGIGRKYGELIGIEVGQDGKITASYDNGISKLLGQIAVANFANAAGLSKAGNNLYSATMNSGEFDGVGSDITADGGTMESGVLEMSNVDLSSEFTEMITTQRGFQANSRIITTSDSLLEELVNLKR